MSQDRGQGIGDRAGVERVPNTPHAGRYFVTDAILLASEQEVTEPIRSIDQTLITLESDMADLHLLVRDEQNWDVPIAPAATRFRKCEQFRLHLIRIAATAMQAAKQLGLDSRQDAIAKEIPF
jgi:hypothetical protein